LIFIPAGPKGVGDIRGKVLMSVVNYGRRRDLSIIWEFRNIIHAYLPKRYNFSNKKLHG
jgi:hypothetical protein